MSSSALSAKSLEKRIFCTSHLSDSECNAIYNSPGILLLLAFVVFVNSNKMLLCLWRTMIATGLMPDTTVSPSLSPSPSPPPSLSTTLSSSSPYSLLSSSNTTTWGNSPLYVGKTEIPKY
uniref:Uncharacterized protein n=1 Tax=Glossina austeni TaxID=7395 RepID=A0A1A9UMX3_GLOAU